MDFEELKALIQKATANFEAQKKENEKVVADLNHMSVKYDNLKADFDKLKEVGDADGAKKLANTIDELQNEMSDLRTKMKAPALAITEADQKKAIQHIVMKAFGAAIKGAKNAKGDILEAIRENVDIQVKALNLTTPAQGGLAVAEVLSMDIMDYAREFSPIAQHVMMKSDMTRDYRQLIKVTYPSVAEGIENVAGTVPAETSTQTYVEVKASEFKLYAQPRITNEALYGADINVYQDLIQSLGEEIGIYLAAQLLYGNGVGKNARGILSSNRVDITDGTGESWKPTLTPTGVGARNPDFFPVKATGVSGSLGADDIAAMDFIIDVCNTLPTRYLANAAFYMNRKTKGVFEKLRDGEDRPLLMYDFIEGLPGRRLILNGFPVIIDDKMPDIAANSTFAIFGDLSKAFALAPGDIDQMLLDPYTIKGCLLVYTEKEYFEMVQRSDAILVLAATANDGVV